MSFPSQFQFPSTEVSVGFGATPSAPEISFTSTAFGGMTGMTVALGSTNYYNSRVYEFPDYTPALSDATVLGTFSGSTVFGQTQFVTFMAVTIPTFQVTYSPPGLKYVFHCGNVWDDCLLKEQAIHRAQQPKAPPSLLSSKCFRDDYEPWNISPIEGRELRKAASISLPPANGVDTLALTYQIPQGYDGVIWALMLRFDGGGFQEGSGDITWRLRKGRRWIKSLFSITTTLGTYSSPYQLSAPIILSSTSKFRVYVNVSTNGLTLNPAGIVNVAVYGWEWPHPASGVGMGYTDAARNTGS